MMIILDQLENDFAAFAARNGLPPEGDAIELLHRSDLTPEQRRWISDFVGLWETAERLQSYFERIATA